MAPTSARPAFHPVDYVLLVVSLVVSLAVGIYQAVSGRNVRTTSDYLMGGRLLGVLPVTLSLIASFISSIAIVGFPAEVYFFGIQIIIVMVGVFFAALMSAFLFVPLFHPLGITTVQEYLQMRFKSRVISLFGTGISLMTQLFYAGCVVYGQAAALEATTGLPPLASIFLINVLATVYTTIGGMKAVVWTDVFQVIIIFGSLITINIIALVNVGGPARMWDLNQQWGRIYFEFHPSMYKRLSVLPMFLSCIIDWTTSYGIFQTSVQRFCAIPDVKRAKRSMLLNAVGVVCIGLLCALTGLVLFAFYADQGCDPLADGKITSPNQILPYYVMEVLSHPGLPGIFVSGLVSGSLSTLSSCITSMCAVLWEDILKPVVGERLHPSRHVVITKLISAGVGMACLCVALLVNAVGGSLLQITSTLYALCSGPTLGIFVLGALFPWANWIGAVAGGAISLAITSWIFVGQVILSAQSEPLPTPTDGCQPYNMSTKNLNISSIDGNFIITDIAHLTTETLSTASSITSDVSFLDEWLYSISFIWFGIIGFILCIGFGLLVSFISGPTDPSTVEKANLFTFMRKRFGKTSTDQTDCEKKVTKPLVGLQSTMDKDHSATSV